MSLSIGCPGSVLLRMPSMAAIIMAENVRYGLLLGSGHRNSMRLAFGDAEYIGMRMEALRFLREYARFTGASKPGTSLLKLFVVGVANASSEGACFSRPPMAYSAICDSPA